MGLTPTVATVDSPAIEVRPGESRVLGKLVMTSPKSLLASLGHDHVLSGLASRLGAAARFLIHEGVVDELMSGSRHMTPLKLQLPSRRMAIHSWRTELVDDRGRRVDPASTFLHHVSYTPLSYTLSAVHPKCTLAATPPYILSAHF